MQTFNTVSSSEIINPRLIREWRHDDQMIIYTLSSTESTFVTDYANANLETVRFWSPEQVMYAVHDLSANGMALTQHLCTCLDNLAQTTVDAGIQMEIALILPDTLMYRIFTRFGQTLMQRSQGHITLHYFTDRAKGIAWAERQLQARQQTSAD